MWTNQGIFATIKVLKFWILYFPNGRTLVSCFNPKTFVVVPVAAFRSPNKTKAGELCGEAKSIHERAKEVLDTFTSCLLNGWQFSGGLW